MTDIRQEHQSIIISVSHFVPNSLRKYTNISVLLFVPNSLGKYWEWRMICIATKTHSLHDHQFCHVHQICQPSIGLCFSMPSFPHLYPLSFLSEGMLHGGTWSKLICGIHENSREYYWSEEGNLPELAPLATLFSTHMLIDCFKCFMFLFVP